MVKRKLARLVGVMFAAVLFLASTRPLPAQEKFISFTGDILINENNSVTKAKLYVKGPFTRRVEMSKEAGGAIFIRTKDARSKIWMLYPAKKQYKVLSWPETHEDPVSAWTDIQYEMEGNLAGKDTVNGHPCVVYKYNYPGKDTVSLRVWLAKDVHYVIKRVSNVTRIAVKKNAAPKIIKGTYQILNIKVKKLDDALFKIPADYTEIK